MMNKKKAAVTAMVSVLSAGMMFIPAMGAMAASDAEYSKNENVYVRMDSKGQEDGIYVINTFHVLDDGEITDYGDYDSIKNLTNLEEIEKDKDMYSIYAEEGKFYYQGDLDHAELPWNFDIEYILDGKDVNEEELAGGDGDLEIHLTVSENLAAVNPVFSKSYMLQISFTLDSALCKNITAEGASIADAGSNEQITFTVMPPAANADPAENSEEPQKTELVIKAEVENFEMDDISIAGAAMQENPVSFVSEKNDHMGKTMFIMSVKGIEIPEEEEAEEKTEDNRNFFEKLIDRFKNRDKE